MAKVIIDTSEVEVVIPRTEPLKEMISATKLPDGRTKVRINSSSLSVIQECMRKAKYNLVERWMPEHESPALTYGSAIHSALEVFYTGAITERKMPKLEDLTLMSYGHAIDGDEEDLVLRSVKAFIKKAQPLAILPEVDKRSIQTGVWTLFHYFKDFINDPYVAHRDADGIAMVERDVSYIVYEDENIVIEYFGRIDLVVKHLESNDIHVCDHKTSSVVGNDFYNRLKPNHQYTGYLLGARKVLGLDTNTFLVNCIQVKAKPLTARGAPPHFPRQITTRNEDDYREFTEAVIKTAKEYVLAVETNVWPMGHVNACAHYGGCSYLSVCSAANSLRSNVLNSKFIRGDQNVIK